MTEQNGHKPWGTIKQVTNDEVPPARVTVWYELYDELCLRLEQTNSKCWLEIPFEEENIMRNAMASVGRYFFTRKGDKVVEMRSKVLNGRCVLYVRRGPNWEK